MRYTNLRLLTYLLLLQACTVRLRPAVRQAVLRLAWPKETVTAFSCLTHTCNIRGHNNFVASSLLCSCLANVYVIGHFWSNMALFRVICSILCSLFIVSGIIDNGNCFLVCNSFRLCTITRLSFLTVSSCSKGFPVNSYQYAAKGHELTQLHNVVARGNGLIL